MKIINSTIALKLKKGVWEKVVPEKKEISDENFLGYLESMTVNIENECSGEDIVPGLREYEDCK